MSKKKISHISHSPLLQLIIPHHPSGCMGYVPKNTALRTESDTAVTHVGSSQVGAHVLREIV